MVSLNVAIFKLRKQLPLTDFGNGLFSLSDNFVRQLFLFLSCLLSKSKQTNKQKTPTKNQKPNAL